MRIAAALIGSDRNTTHRNRDRQCRQLAQLSRAPGGKPRQLCPGSADADFVSYFNGSISLRNSTPWPLLRVSHDYFWVLRDAFLWNERDPHAPAGIVSEELSELGQGQLFVVDVNGDLAVRAAVVSNATQHLAARHPLVAIFAALYLSACQAESR